jgi:hypothetical protein
VINQ